MTKYLAAFGVFTLLLAPGAVWAQDKQEKSVIVVEGDKLPKVKVGDVVRLTQSAAVGRTDIRAAVEGPARLVSTTRVRKFVNGRPLIGAVTKEFEVRAEKKGKAVIKIIIDDLVEKKTQTREYELEIE